MTLSPSSDYRPLNLLYYCEMHPFRNSYSEHAHVARMLVPALAPLASKGQLQFRVLANNDVINSLTREFPDHVNLLQRPTATESHAIDAQFGRWDESAISNWVDLVNGTGTLTDLYMSILDRLHSEQPIDAIVTWSENGAVRQFGRKHEIPVLFGELGPTRPPFPQTMYFDKQGTNGHASFRRDVRALLESDQFDPTTVLNSGSWLLPSERMNAQQTLTRSLIDIGVTVSPETQVNLPQKPYFFVPMQLADDLNTLLHSDFDTPLSFLQHVAGLAEENGYELVVKGHPAIKGRPYNMRREIEALDWLVENCPSAVVLERDCDTTVSNYAMANAAYTVSINSSVGFESMILGVPALVLGQAAYDAEGWLQKNIPLLPADVQRNFREPINRLVSIYMDHVLVPQEIALGSKYLLNRLRNLVAGIDLPITANTFSDWHFLGKETLSLPRRPALGLWRIEPGSTMTLTQDQIIFSDPNQFEEVTLSNLQCCMGYVDEISLQDNGSYRIRGWAIDTRRMTAPMSILLISEGKLVSQHRFAMQRDDVCTAFADVPQSVPCGFMFEAQIENPAQLQLVLRTSDGSAHLVNHVMEATSFAQAVSGPTTASPSAEVPSTEGPSEDTVDTDMLKKLLTKMRFKAQP